MADDLLTRLTELNAKLKSLDDSMASGVLRLEDADTGSLTNRTYPEMRQARADLVSRIRDLELQISPVVVRRTRQVVMIGRSGW